MQVAEVLLLAGLIASLYGLLAPLRRRLERTFARLLRRRASSPRARVVELARRRDGGFGAEDEHGR